ncbi:hypothetical protein N431DRAFT_172649 [Stipitochalara longipes BDJ]|nr:hypothetical protein N431DRAFT_172649 [Stipitochalara longipes BDJ]
MPAVLSAAASYFTPGSNVSSSLVSALILTAISMPPMTPTSSNSISYPKTFIVPRDTQINFGVLIGFVIATAIILVTIICLLSSHYLPKRRCYICHSPYYLPRRRRRHHTSCAVSLPTRSYSSGSSTTSSDSWRRWYRERERHRRRNGPWRIKEELYDRGIGLGYNNRYRGVLNGGGGWPSPQGGFGMERDVRERGLDLGPRSPRLGEGVARGRNTLGLGAGLGGGLGGGGLVG